MTIDWWAIIAQSVGTAVDTWAQAFNANPLPWLGLIALALVGFLLPKRRRRS